MSVHVGLGDRATFSNPVRTKPYSVRIYDKDGFRQRAACVCVRNEAEDEILLVSSSGARDYWVVPGGGVEFNEEPSTAAQRESLEEAGVKGVISRCLGVFEMSLLRFRNELVSIVIKTIGNGSIGRPSLSFKYELLDDWEDLRDFGRVRRWFPIQDARRVLDPRKPLQKRYLDLLACSRPLRPRNFLDLSRIQSYTPPPSDKKHCRAHTLPPHALSQHHPSDDTVSPGSNFVTSSNKSTFDHLLPAEKRSKGNATPPTAATTNDGEIG